MKIGDSKYLKCINCGSDLDVIGYLKKKKEIIDGKVFCINCMAEWPIIKGIPRILRKNLFENLIYLEYKDFFMKYEKDFKFTAEDLDLNTTSEKIETARSFGYEWLKYSKIIKEFEKDWKRYFSPFIKPSDIKHKTVADIGCGLAKQGYFTAKYGAKYIGIDLSKAVDAAYNNTKGFNPLIIQADVYNLPLNGDLIDLYYSIGVLHHLPTPKKGFLKIVSLMKSSSKILIWVYSGYKNKRASYIYEPLRKITTKLRKNFLYYLCFFPAIIIHILNKYSLFLEKVGAKSSAKRIPFYYYKDFPFSFKLNDSFDILATPKQDYFSKEQIEDWFCSAKIKKYKLMYDIIQGVKGYGIK